MSKSVDNIPNRILNSLETPVNLLTEVVEVRRGLLYRFCSTIYGLGLTAAADSGRSMKSRQVPPAPSEPRSNSDEINDDSHDHAHLAAMNKF